MASKDKKSTKPASILALLLLGIVKFYQLVISPLLGPNCRFQPTCSAYASEAIRVHGGLKGGRLAIKRIIRCHPWGGFGYDPVPKSDAAPETAHGGAQCGCDNARQAGNDRPTDQGKTSNG